MTTNEGILPLIEAPQFGTPPDTITRKEKELSALLDRVLATPFEPVLKILNDLSIRAKRSGDKLDEFANELNSVDENIRKIKRVADDNSGNLEELDKELCEIAKISGRAEAEAATRYSHLLEALNASRLEAQQAMRAATRNARIIQILLASLLVTFVVHLAFEVWG